MLFVRQAALNLTALLGLTMLLNGCATVRYDDQLESLVGTTTNDFHALTSGLESTAAELQVLRTRKDHLYDQELADAQKQITFAANVPAYEKVRVDLLNMRIRVVASSGLVQAKLQSAIDQIEANLFGDGSLRAVHMQQDAVSTNYVRTEEAIVDQQLQALTVYVLVTKSGRPAGPVNP